MKEKGNCQIYKDAFRYIWFPAIVSILSTCFEYLLLVVYADIFGEFADAVFTLDFSAGIKLLSDFVIALTLTIIAVPALKYSCDVVLIKNASKHDRIVLSRFLDKRFNTVREIEPGEMLSRLDDEPNELRLNLLSICSSIVLIPGIMIYLIISVMKTLLVYFLIVCVISIVKFIVPILIKNIEKKYHKETKEYNSEVSSIETDLANRAHYVVLFGMCEAMIKRLDSRYKAFFEKTSRKSIRLSEATQSVRTFTDKICLIIVLLVGSYFIASNRISPGSVATMMVYYSVLNKVIGEGDNLIRTFPIIKNNVERLTYFYCDIEKETGKSIDDVKSLSIKNLAFSYADKQVLGPISFSILNGEKVALCGINGSGKTTLLKIMLGLLNEYDGQYYINSDELSVLSLRSYQNLLSYVPQDPYLFKGTVIDNIMFANPKADNTEVMRLMDDYGILHLYEREVGIGGSELSGGEKQRVAIVRAMIKDASIILLDEIENNLDSIAVKKTKEWIRKNNKTIVYISHRPDLIACADKIIELPE